jgi:hypothetical protein
MNRRDTIRMAREAGFLIDGVQEFVFAPSSFHFTEELSAFAVLVAAAATEESNRRANASWTLMCEKMVAVERRANIACIGRIAALVGDPIDQARLHEAMDAIQART